MNRELSIEAAWQAVMSRWRIVVALAGAGIIVSSLYTVLSPDIYVCESVVKVPETVRYQLHADFIGNVAGLVNVAETQLMVDHHWQEARRSPADQGGGFDQGSIINVWAENIVGSNSYFRLIVKSKGTSEAAFLMSEALVNKLNGNDFIKSKIDSERGNVENVLRDTKKSLDNALAMRQQLEKTQGQGLRSAFNPVEVETKVSELSQKYHNVKNDLALIHGYEFVIKPVSIKVPKSRRLLFNSLSFAFLGLIAGAVAAIYIGFFPRRKPTA
jgi:hypothetical protein